MLTVALRGSWRRGVADWLEVLGGAALARSEEAAASSRTSRSDLRLVHEGFDTLDLKEAKALLEELAC